MLMKNHVSSNKDDKETACGEMMINQNQFLAASDTQMRTKNQLVENDSYVTTRLNYF